MTSEGVGGGYDNQQQPVEALLQRIPASVGVDAGVAQDSARTFATTINGLMASARALFAKEAAQHEERDFGAYTNNNVHLKRHSGNEDNYEIEIDSGNGELISLRSNLEIDGDSSAYIPGFPYKLFVRGVDGQIGLPAQDYLHMNPTQEFLFGQIYFFNSEGEFRKLIQMPTEVAGERDDILWRPDGVDVVGVLAPMEPRNFEAVLGHLEEIKQQITSFE